MVEAPPFMCLPDLALEFAEQIQDVGRSRRVQRRGRFIGQDELWPAGESWREDRASVAVASRLSVTVPATVGVMIRRRSESRAAKSAHVM